MIFTMENNQHLTYLSLTMNYFLLECCCTAKTNCCIIFQRKRFKKCYINDGDLTYRTFSGEDWEFSRE